jgi:hypothetical protein
MVAVGGDGVVAVGRHLGRGQGPAGGGGGSHQPAQRRRHRNGKGRRRLAAGQGDVVMGRPAVRRAAGLLQQIGQPVVVLGLGIGATGPDHHRLPGPGRLQERTGVVLVVLVLSFITEPETAQSPLEQVQGRLEVGQGLGPLGPGEAGHGVAPVARVPDQHLQCVPPRSGVGLEGFQLIGSGDTLGRRQCGVLKGLGV